MTCAWRAVLASTLAQLAGIEGERLVTRPLGRLFLPRLRDELIGGPERCMALSFNGIDMMDGSFADEVFAGLAVDRSRRIGLSGCLVLRDLDPTSYDNLLLAMTSRPVREPGVRNCVLPVVRENGRLELVGKAEDHVRETFDYLQKRQRLTAREFADGAGLEIAAASTRLKSLFDLGLACRREDRDDRGRLFVYSSIA